MITEKTLLPGDPGSKKWVKQYGIELICIRYRYDSKRNLRVKTVELIAEEKPYRINRKKIPANKKVKIRVRYGEVETGKLVREAGGIWNKAEKVWIISYGQVKALGLINRIVS